MTGPGNGHGCHFINSTETAIGRLVHHHQQHPQQTNSTSTSSHIISHHLTTHAWQSPGAFSFLRITSCQVHLLASSSLRFMYLFCFKEIAVQWMIAAHRLVLLVMDHFLWTYDDLNTKALFKKNLQVPLFLGRDVYRSAKLDLPECNSPHFLLFVQSCQRPFWMPSFECWSSSNWKPFFHHGLWIIFTFAASRNWLVMMQSEMKLVLATNW